MTIWLCPECHERLDRSESIGVDFSRDHTDRRCASCDKARLAVVPDPDED